MEARSHCSARKSRKSSSPAHSLQNAWHSPALRRTAVRATSWRSTSVRKASLACPLKSMCRHSTGSWVATRRQERHTPAAAPSTSSTWSILLKTYSNASTGSSAQSLDDGKAWNALRGSALGFFFLWL